MGIREPPLSLYHCVEFWLSLICRLLTAVGRAVIIGDRFRGEFIGVLTAEGLLWIAEIEGNVFLTSSISG